MPDFPADLTNRICSHLCDCKLLIIDEVSMVGRRQFYQVDKRLKQIFKSHENLGGISVLCLGDFHQLKPVGDSYVFFSGRANQLQNLGQSLWEGFSIFELTTVMRQRDDVAFAVALNHMSSTVMTPEDVQLLKNCEVKPDRQPPSSAIHLFQSNAEADAFNTTAILFKPGDSLTASAIDHCSGDGPQGKKDEFLLQFKKKSPNETFGLASVLILKKEVRYMLRINLDTSDGLVNGAIRKLKRVGQGESPRYGTITVRIWIEFEDHNTGCNCRSTFIEWMKREGIPNSWTPIEPVCRQLSTGKRDPY
ncbi:hypothetical protein JTE90_000005 [Oedothorax gibbosus]|uniref:ATP-dependent DNA helicase n=1 Tax=Oedothorax gibbosus TaxID=931172 RepID=A0AAV6TXA1_9ARAC|nr:hypothetical protein JTE90_000005 [Oedothorax gibbosus]